MADRVADVRGRSEALNLRAFGAVGAEADWSSEAVAASGAGATAAGVAMMHQSPILARLEGTREIELVDKNVSSGVGRSLCHRACRQRELDSSGLEFTARYSLRDDVSQ